MQIIIYFLLIFSYMYLKISRDSILIMKENVQFLAKLKIGCILFLFLLTSFFDFSKKSHRLIFIGFSSIVLIFIPLTQHIPYLPNILHYFLTEMIAVTIGVSFWSITKKRNVLFGSAIATCIAGGLQYFSMFNYYLPCITLILGNILLINQPIILKPNETKEFKFKLIFLFAFFVNCFTGCIDFIGKNVIKSYSSDAIMYNKYVALFWICEGILSLILILFSFSMSQIYFLPYSQFLFFISNLVPILGVGHVLINKVIKHNIYNITKRQYLSTESDLKYTNLFGKYGKYFAAIVILFSSYLNLTLLILIILNLSLSYYIYYNYQKNI